MSTYLAGSASGWFLDELDVLDWKLRDGRFDLTSAAIARVDDLTTEGLAQLASNIAFGHLSQAEVDEGLRSGMGYPKFLLPYSWTSQRQDWNANEKPLDKLAIAIAQQVHLH